MVTLLEYAIEFDNVRMVETSMQSNLFDKLIHHVMFYDHFFIDHFNRCQKSSLMVSS